MPKTPDFQLSWVELNLVRAYRSNSNEGKAMLLAMAESGANIQRQKCKRPELRLIACGGGQ